MDNLIKLIIKNGHLWAIFEKHKKTCKPLTTMITPIFNALNNISHPHHFKDKSSVISIVTEDFTITCGQFVDI